MHLRQKKKDKEKRGDTTQIGKFQWVVLRPGRPRSPSLIGGHGNMVRKAGTVSEHQLREFWHRQCAVLSVTIHEAEGKKT